MLRAAKQLYFQGESRDALDLLEGLQLRLAAGEEPGWDVSTEAMTYLGEIHYKLDQFEGARTAFRWLLERDPHTPISPYHHPIDVVNLFELVRSAVVAERQDLVPPDPVPFDPAPPPLWTFAPLGIPQFAQGRTGAGLAFGGLQAGFGVASVALWAHFRLVNVPSTGHPLGWSDEERIRRVQQRRYFVQWPATVAFYGVWSLSAADAARYHRQQALRVGVGTVSGHTAGLTLQGRL